MYLFPSSPATHLKELGGVELDDAGVDALRQGGDNCGSGWHVDACREGFGGEDHLQHKQRKTKKTTKKKC